MDIFEYQTLEQNKKDLLAAYCRYSTYVRKLEAFVYGYTKPELAEFKFYKEFGQMALEYGHVPWKLSYASDEQKQNFDDLLNNCSKNDPDDCYIGMKYNFDNPQTKGCFRSLPASLGVESDILMFPSLYEYYVAAFKKDAMLKDVAFVVDGRFSIKYNASHYKEDHLTVAEALQSLQFTDRLLSMLTATAVLDWYNKNNMNLTPVHNEAYASRLLQPIETVILNAMARNAEISRNIINDIYKSRNALQLAEKNGLIPSAANMQDYLNIRHLLHHQCDSLGGYGSFSTDLAEKRHDRRGELLASYSKICDKMLQERLDSYVEVMKDFRPLVQHFHPNLLSRGEHESVSKFVSRIKEYHRKNPDDELILELNYDAKNPKTAQMMKNIKKLFPKAEVIDNPEVKIDSIFQEMENYGQLNIYLHTHQELDNYLGLYSLTHGKSLNSMMAAKFMQERGDIDKATYEQIVRVRETRNKLSHNYFTSDMAQQLYSAAENLTNVFFKIKDVMSKLPSGTLVEGDIYRFEHSDGKIVDVNFKERKIIRADVLNKLNKNRSVKKENFITTNKSTETKLLADGTIINYGNRSIVFGDKSVLHFNSDENYCWSIKDTLSGKNAKFLTDKSFKLKKFIYNGREIAFSRGDVLSHVPTYMVFLDNQGRLGRYVYKEPDGRRTLTQFNVNRKNNICLPDGTILDMTSGKPEVSGKQQTQQKNNGGRS